MNKALSQTIVTRISLFLTLSPILVGCITSRIVEVERKKEDVVIDVIHGKEVRDDWRWMETDEVRLKKWLLEQQKRTSSYLQNIEMNSNLRQSIERRLADAESKRDIKLVNNGLFYKVVEPETGQTVLNFLPSNSNLPQAVLRPTDVKSNKSEKSSISYYFPSPTGQYVVFGMTQGGSEISKLFILNVKSKEITETQIGDTQYPNIFFLPQEKGFVYVRHDSFADPDPKEKFSLSRVRVHRFGRSAANDAIVAGHGILARPAFERGLYYRLRILERPNVAVLAVSRGTTSPYRFYVKRFADLENTNKPWTAFLSEAEGIEDFTTDEEAMYLVSRDSSNRSQIEKVSFKHTEAERVIVQEASGLSISDLRSAQDAVYAIGKEKMADSVLRLTKDGRLENYVLPPGESVDGIYTAGKEVAGVYLERGSFQKPTTIERFDTAKKIFQPLIGTMSREPIAALEIVEEFATSLDQTKVPYVIVKNKGQPLHQDTPVLLMSYAAYGVSLVPTYDRVSDAWFAKGGVRVYCHARGGGELGDSWHKAGQRKNKINSLMDTIACAEDLIKKAYTSTAKLAVYSGSAGGIIVGGIVAQRPDLVRAVVVDVGVLNLSRNQQRPSGLANVVEYGDIRDPEEAAVILQLDAFLNLKPDQSYPSVLVTHGYNDARVPIWMSAKFAAKLQSYQVGKNPILMRTDFNEGHGLTVSSVAGRASLWGDIYSFLFQELGLDYR